MGEKMRQKNDDNERYQRWLEWARKQTKCCRCGREFEKGEQRWEWTPGFLCEKCFKEHVPIALGRLNRLLAGEKIDD
jgi:Zn finger protein HypA/HybF involved in hydrogenase expression